MLKIRLAAVTSATALASIAAVFSPGVSSGQAPPCTPANNIEAVIDDSGSMLGTDGSLNRVQALKLLVEKQSNAQKNLGAVEFGSDAATLFKPTLIGPNKAALNAALAKVQGDNGSTDYNAAFTLGNADNPNAQARIFLTDGGHNGDTYTNGHVGGGKPRTYVIGFGTSTAGEDGARLQQIATETGGQYFPQVDASKLVSTMNQIDAALACLGAPKQFTQTFTKVGQSKLAGLKLATTTRSVQIVSNYPAGAEVAVKVEQLKGGQVVAAKRKIKKLKITRSKGDTFLSLQVRGIKPGLKMRLKIKARKLGLPQLGSTAPGTQVVTQITQSRKR